MKLKHLIVATAVASFGSVSAASGDLYADFPVTLKGYDGDATTSVAYTGQMARHVLHNSLKKLAGSGTGDNADELLEQMLAYFEGADSLDIIDPASKSGFAIKQSTVEAISTGKNLSGKAYGGYVTGWPGQMTGAEVLRFMIEKAAETEGGYDPVNGYNYAQLISKFAMGAVFYNQAVDNYLDERIEGDVKPNDEPYKDGAYYTGKEHVWDEGFGYFGAPAHALTLDPATAYSIAKQDPDVFDEADYNGDGEVDLVTEMTYAHAYYAANADKGGQSNYLPTIMQAFIDGRQLIADADGEKLSDDELDQLQDYADTIKSNWERVIAEAAFKYAGSVYSDAMALHEAVEEGNSVKDLMPAYVKHWGELKGFAMSLQTGGKDLGSVGVQLDRLIGFGPVLLGSTQVTGIDGDGDYIQSESITLKEYAMNMLEVQTLLAQNFHLVARNNDRLGNLEALSEQLESGGNVEND